MTDAAWLALRAVGLILSLQAAGAVLFTLVFRGEPAHAAATARRVALRYALTALAVVLMQVLLEPVQLAGEWSGMTDPQLLQVFLGSSTALALAVRGAGLIALALLLRPVAFPRVLRARLALPACLATLGSFLLSGHTSVSPQRELLVPLLLLHVTIVAFWFGALWPLRQLAVRAAQGDAAQAPAARAEAARALQAFSRVAGWLVPLIALAGLAMALVLLPDAAAWWRPYGLALQAKLLLFAALMGLAALNRRQLVPGLAQGAPGAAARLQSSLTAEYVLICVVLAVTAVMTGSLSPRA
jgi:putative copper export protein